MKKLVMAVLVLAGLGVAGIRMADAGPRWGYDRAGGGPATCWSGGGPGDCWSGRGPGWQAPDEETRKAMDKFEAETQGLRKELVSKQAEFTALMRQESPEPAKVGALRGEIFDLEAKIDQAAEAAGLPGRGVYAGGPGSCAGPGFGRGYMWSR